MCIEDIKELRDNVLQQWHSKGLKVTFESKTTTCKDREGVTVPEDEYTDQQDYLFEASALSESWTFYPRFFRDSVNDYVHTVWNFRLEFKPGTFQAIQVILISGKQPNNNETWGLDVVTGFDLTACQFWVQRDSSERGYSVHGTASATAEIEKGTMCFQTASHVPFGVSLYRIRKYVLRGFRLRGISMRHNTYGNYALAHLNRALGLEQELTMDDLKPTRPGGSTEPAAEILSLLLLQKEWVESYVRSTAFFDYDEFREAHTAGGPLRRSLYLNNWYEETAEKFLNSF